MFQHRPQPSRLGLILRMMVMALLVFTFITIVIITAVALLTGESLAISPAAIFAARPSPRPGPTPTIAPLAAVTPGPLELTTFRSVALGFTANYPAGWRKKESALRVIFAPTTAGLEPKESVGATIWVGIPTDNSFEPAAVLANILADFPANIKHSPRGSTTMAGIPWTITDLAFANETTGQPGMARLAVASKNEVGYFVVVAAPAEQWSTAEPVFEAMLNSFRFNQEAVIKPTDATPPPTPTPSPTPRIYIVQPGDTLGGIALQFDVTIEAIITRNGLEDPRLIRTGQELIIPNKRK